MIIIVEEIYTIIYKNTIRFEIIYILFFILHPFFLLLIIDIPTVQHQPNG